MHAGLAQHRGVAAKLDGVERVDSINLADLQSLVEHRRLHSRPRRSRPNVRARRWLDVGPAVLPAATTLDAASIATTGAPIRNRPGPGHGAACREIGSETAPAP